MQGSASAAFYDVRPITLTGVDKEGLTGTIGEFVSAFARKVGPRQLDGPGGVGREISIGKGAGSDP